MKYFYVKNNKFFFSNLFFFSKSFLKLLINKIFKNGFFLKIFLKLHNCIEFIFKSFSSKYFLKFFYFNELFFILNNNLFFFNYCLLLFWNFINFNLLFFFKLQYSQKNKKIKFFYLTKIQKIKYFFFIFCVNMKLTKAVLKNKFIEVFNDLLFNFKNSKMFKFKFIIYKKFLT